MANTVLDLWPKSLGTIDLVAPVTILREQATLLGQKTRNILTALVQTRPLKNGFRHDFDVRAIALGGFTMTLIEVEHPIMVYPAVVTHYWYDDAGRLANETFTCADESEFVETLRTALASPQTLRIINSLLAQSVSVRTQEENEADQEDNPLSFVGANNSSSNPQPH